MVVLRSGLLRIVRSGWLSSRLDRRQAEIKCFVKDLYFCRLEFIIFTTKFFFFCSEKEMEELLCFLLVHAQVQCFRSNESPLGKSGLFVFVSVVWKCCTAFKSIIFVNKTNWIKLQCERSLCANFPSLMCFYLLFLYERDTASSGTSVFNCCIHIYPVFRYRCYSTS